MKRMYFFLVVLRQTGQTNFLKNAFKHYSFLNRFHFPLGVPDCYPLTNKKKRRENA